MEITEELIAEHGLTPEEYEEVLTHLGRVPTYTELGIFSVMWSEHCSYKSSRAHLKGLPTDGPQVIQGPGENAGIVDIGDGLAAVFKMESHNHPSFIEPYQGAATGVGGIMRDVFTMGARPVANLNSLKFGTFANSKTSYLVDGVVGGIAGYGNCMGVPTVAGEVYFDESYNGNCLVNAMTVGIVKKDKIFLGTASGVGNPIIYVGSRTGRDGIHGAVMASDVFGEGGEERRPTVQVGDPFAEKLLLEACLELFRSDCVIGIQDMGAAGLTSSSVEMASRGGAGIEIDIDKVPRREEGMTAYECLLSESQERMLMVVKEGREEEVSKIFDKWDLESEVIGHVVEGDSIRVLEGGEVVADIPVSALTDGAPVYTPEDKRPIARPVDQDEITALDIDSIPLPDDLGDVLLKLVTSPNLASRRWVYRQYDHMVRTDTVVLPGSDSGIIRVKGTGKGLAMTSDCNPRYCRLEPRLGAAIAVAEGARNLAVSGAKPLALTDCLNFGSPERPEVMWQFSEAIKGIGEACRAFSVPVIGGNVSLYNETSGVSVHPTPTIGMVGLIEDVDKRGTQWFKSEGDIIILLGDTLSELGGSEYLYSHHGLTKGMPPHLDMEREGALHRVCLRAIGECLLESAHDLSEGGLGVGLVEAAMGPDDHARAPLGFSVDLSALELSGAGGERGDIKLFSESQSRALVSVKGSNLAGLEGICREGGVSLTNIGTVGGDDMTVEGLFSLPAAKVKEAWSAALENFIKTS